MRKHKRAFSLNGKLLFLHDIFIYTHFIYRFHVPNARSRVLPFYHKLDPFNYAETSHFRVAGMHDVIWEALSLFSVRV